MNVTLPTQSNRFEVDFLSSRMVPLSWFEREREPHRMPAFLRLVLLITLLAVSNSALNGQTTLRTQIVGNVVPCADGGEFIVRLHMDTSRSDIRSFSSGFTWYANLFELVDVSKAPGFDGEFEDSSSTAGPVGTVGFGATSSQLFSGIPAGPILDFTFRTRTALITDQPFIEAPGTNPLFLTTGFSTFTGSTNFDATDFVTCSGDINPGDQFGLLRTRLAEPVPCEVGQRFDLEIHMETNALPLERIITNFTYRGDRYEFVSARNGPAFNGIVDSTGNESGSLGTFAMNLNGDDDPNAFTEGVVMIARFEVLQANLSNVPFTARPDFISTETRFFIEDDDFFGSLVLTETETISCESVEPAIEAETWAIH